MDVVFTEFAEAGFLRAVPDDVKRPGIRHAVIWKLSKDPGFQSRPCPLPAPVPLRVGVIFIGRSYLRLLYTLGDTLTILSCAVVEDPKG